MQGAQGPAGNAATITIGNVTTSAPGTSAQVTNRGTSSAAVLDFVLPKGKDGADGGVTVDDTLSSTSTNPVQNNVIYNALLNKAGTDIFSGFSLMGAGATINWRQGSQPVGSINATNYTGTASAATHDGAGNVITETYTKKADFDKTIGQLQVAFQEKVDRSDLSDVATSGQYSDLRGKPEYVVQSVNNVRPDENGNVSISVSGGSNVTVDTTLSATSNNAIANKAVYNALNGKLDKTGTAEYARKDSAGNVISSTYIKTVNNVKPDASGNVTIAVGGGSNVTVDTVLSPTSTNAIANKTVYNALSGKLDKTGTAEYARKDSAGNVISSTYIKTVNNVKPDASGNVTIAVGGGSNVTVDTVLSPTSTNAIANKTVYNALSGKLDKTGTAEYATRDGAGNIITDTYAKKSEVSGGVSTSESNTWTAQQNFHDLMLDREKYTTYVVNGTSDTPITSTMVYAVTGAFTLNLATLAGALSASQSSVFTAYFAANADYSLTISNAGKLKYTGSASDVAITTSGLLLNIWMSKDGGGTLTSIVQASKLS